LDADYPDTGSFLHAGSQYSRTCRAAKK
jgi:hypothetical protein